MLRWNEISSIHQTTRAIFWRQKLDHFKKGSATQKDELQYVATKPLQDVGDGK